MTLRVHPDEIVRNSTSSLLGTHTSWERVRLGDVADVLNGFAFKSTLFSREDGMPLIRIRDVGSHTTQVRYAGEFDSRYLVEPGTILAGMDGDFRAARWRGEPALLNQRVCTIRVRNPHLYDEDFLLHALPGYLDAIHGATSSITVKHLSSETIKQIPLPLPPLAEQRRIAAAIEENLSRLEAACDGLTRVERLLERWRFATLATLTQHLAPRRRIGEVARVGSGATPKRDRPEYWAGGEVPWVTSGQLTRPFVTEPAALITQKALRETSCRVWPKGTLLVALYGEGKTRGHCSELMIDAATNQACAAIQIHDPDVDRAFLKLYFNATYRANRSLSAGGVQPNLSLGLIKDMTFPCPPATEQRAIVARIEEELTHAANLGVAVGKALADSAGLRRSVLARAFRGELVPQDASHEPAIVLLERITAERAARRASTRKRRARTLA